MYNFGRITPPDWAHYDKYPLRSLSLPTAITAEKILKRPPLRVTYDQKETSGCVGFSSSWMMSIYNYPPTEIYNALWLYHRAQEMDGDPWTTPENDNGTYIRAAFEVLRNEGHVQQVQREDLPVDTNNGITSFYWCDDVDEIRTAITLGHPVVFGINWYEEFMYPKLLNYRHWIGESSNWGNVLGGHAICAYGVSDKLGGFRLINSWGTGYPIVYLSYESMSRLLLEDGEAGVAIDNPNG